MGQCSSKEEKYRQKGIPEKEHENTKAEPENMTNKADKDRNSLLVEQVDKNNPVVVKKDVSAKPDKGLGIKHPTSMPPSNKPSTGTKKLSGKMKKSTAKSSDSSSSGWTDSSESSESSDFSYGKEKSKIKQKGNTIVYSKSKSKTTVKGNRYIVEKRKGVLNIFKIREQTVVEKLFSGTGYSLEEACDYEKRQQNEIPAGCLVNLREKHLVHEFVFNTQIRADASFWVGIIRLGDVTGTCFRVGDKKIMTTLHVINVMLEKSYIPLHSGKQNLPMSAFFVKSGQQKKRGQVDEPSQVAALSKLKDAYVDFSFIKDDQYRYNEHSVFNLKPLHSIKDVPFFDKGTDCIVLEILPNTKGTPMPLPFSLFSTPKLEEGFHIIGHPGGSKKTFDHVDGFIDPGKEKTKDIHTIKSESKKFLAKHGKNEQDYQFDVSHNIYSKDRFLFHCTSSQGASGAPGVVVDEEGRVIVVTMMLKGYPDWYYDPNCFEIRTEWPKQYCAEQGTSMEAIVKQMQKDNPHLCQEIFDQRGRELCIEVFDQPKKAEILRDLCNQFGRKSPQLKLECDMICDQIYSLEGVKYVYSAYKLTANNDVTFVVSIENDQDKHAVDRFLKSFGIEYDIKMLPFKNNYTTGVNNIRNVQQTDEEIKRLGECIKYLAPRLFLKHKYLSIIQCSKRQVNYKETEETSNFEAYLELYVHAKGYIPIEENPFEKKYNGIPVHVRDGVFLPLGKHAYDIHDNTRMGCAISRRYEKSGTLGLFFEHVQYGLCGIASAHVLLSDRELEQCTMQFGKYLPQDQKEVYQPRFPHMIGKLVEIINKEGDFSRPGLEIGLVAIENRKPENGRFPDPKRGYQ